MSHTTLRRYPWAPQHITRTERANATEEPWRAYKRVEGDELAYRWLILRREGRETLINIIRGTHGLPTLF